MQHELHHIVQSLLGRRHLEEVTGDNLAELVREHPYSPILHLLYSKKLQQSQDPRFAESVAQTALYFSNPHWLHNLLRPKTGREATRALEQAFEEKRAESRAAETTPMVYQRTAWEQPDLRPLPPESAAFSTELQPAPDADDARDIASMQPAEPELVVPEPVEDETVVPEHSIEETAVSETVVTAPAIEESAVPEPILPLSVSPEPVGQETVGADTVMDEPAIPEAVVPVANTAESVGQEPIHTLPGETTRPEQSEPKPGPTPVAAPAADAGLIPLEPLYTIDYFASQGIQLTEEEKQDPLGRKLKSFTEWLKTMKKVHPTRGPIALDLQQEDRIKENAEHSNDQAEVVTEAMAEVYLKQGLKHRAIAVYQKLSLLNPGQSASFAAKIADLNAPQS